MARILRLSFTLIALVLLCAKPAAASIKIAFFKHRMWSGQYLALEPEGRFSHVAIEVEDGWLHASPLKGVEWMPDTAAMGEVASVLSVAGETITKNAVAGYMHQPYDFNFSWIGEAQYCSKLVAQILGIAPRPMVFDSAFWPPAFSSRRGELGLSPDDLYDELSAGQLREQDNMPSKARRTADCKGQLQEI